jgi:16S rRNA (adenine1518-N6/adenine1519-N6)-dimethyltransferase
MLPSTSEFIKKYGLDAKKSLGQNFILDKNFTDKIAKSALEKNKPDFSDEVILEIGPGPASLTRSILDLNPKKLVVIEKDRRCIEILHEIQNFYGASKLEIINEDALKIDENKFFKGQKFKIISNLPYNIGTVLVLRWLKSREQISSMTLMLQKEVAQRFCAKVNDANYGRLAIITKNLAESEILFLVNRAIFTPPPKVMSAILQIKPRQNPLFDVEISKLEKITALAFNQRRKMIKSSLKGAEFDLKIEELLKKLAINETLRPENLDLSQFCDLARHLK